MRKNETLDSFSDKEGNIFLFEAVVQLQLVLCAGIKLVWTWIKTVVLTFARASKWVQSFLELADYFPCHVLLPSRISVGAVNPHFSVTAQKHFIVVENMRFEGHKFLVISTRVSLEGSVPFQSIISMDDGNERAYLKNEQSKAKDEGAFLLPLLK
jgi:hypothetical protein